MTRDEIDGERRSFEEYIALQKQQQALLDCDAARAANDLMRSCVRACIAHVLAYYMSSAYQLLGLYRLMLYTNA